jgi:hypothetical protein
MPCSSARTAASPAVLVDGMLFRPAREAKGARAGEHPVSGARPANKTSAHPPEHLCFI